MITIDSNMWIYYADRGLPEHRKAAAALRKALGGSILINTSVQLEVAHYLIRRFGSDAGRHRLSPFLAFPFVVDPVDEDCARLAIDILAQQAHLGIGGRDATLLASMRRHGSTELWTHDASFAEVPGIKVRDPVK